MRDKAKLEARRQARKQTAKTAEQNEKVKPDTFIYPVDYF